MQLLLEWTGKARWMATKEFTWVCANLSICPKVCPTCPNLRSGPGYDSGHLSTLFQLESGHVSLVSLEV